MMTNALRRLPSAVVLVLATAVVLSLSGVGNQPVNAAPPAAGSAPVTVVNDTANPVPVEAAQDLYQFNVGCYEDTAEDSCYANLSDELTIPVDKRFVIQYVNARIVSDNDEADPREFFWWLNLDGQGLAASFTTTAAKRGGPLQKQWFIGDANVLIYVDEITFGGALPQFTCVANRENETGDNETFNCNFFVSGYFTSKP